MIALLSKLFGFKMQLVNYVRRQPQETLWRI